MSSTEGKGRGGGRGITIVRGAGGGGDEAMLHAPLQLFITPQQVRETVFSDCDSFGVEAQSVLEEDFGARLQLTARRGSNRVLLAEACGGASIEEHYHVQIVQLEIGGTVMVAWYGDEDSFTRTAMEADRRRAEEAFRLAAVLIGVRVRQGLVVVEAAEPFPAG